MNVARTDLNLAKTDKRFPKKGTCMAIYSRCVNARQKLDHVLAHHFPWCQQWQDELKRLFDAYVDRKEAAGILDYDDLLLYWLALVGKENAAAEAVRKLFDRILVDEYQDTNPFRQKSCTALRRRAGASRSWATTRNPSMRSAPPRSKTSSIFRNITPTPPSSRSNKTIAARSRFSRPRTR